MLYLQYVHKFRGKSDAVRANNKEKQKQQNKTKIQTKKKKRKVHELH